MRNPDTLFVALGLALVGLISAHPTEPDERASVDDLLVPRALAPARHPPSTLATRRR